MFSYFYEVIHLLLASVVVTLYLMSVFGECVTAGHHGCCPLFHLAEFLPSLIQRYPSSSEIPHDAWRCPLHAF